MISNQMKNYNYHTFGELNGYGYYKRVVDKLT